MTENRAALHKLIADTAADVSVQNQYWTAGDLADALIATGKLVLIDDGAVERVARAILAAEKGNDSPAIFDGDAEAQDIYEANPDPISPLEVYRLALDRRIAAEREAVPKPTRAQMEYKWKRRAEESEARAAAAEARESKLRESLTQLLTDMHEATCNGMSWITYEEVQVMKHRARAAIEENQRGQG